MRMLPWAPYRPNPAAPWNLERAWTLRRRAGFGATWAELERDVADGPDAAVARVLNGQCRSDGVPPDFAQVADLLGNAAGASADPNRLQAWWLYRALFTPDPLQERLALAWHDHFATSQLKVNDVAAMHRQNQTFRRCGRGPFGDLLREMLRDPALNVWLDAPSNRKGSPNENLARELMELFALGAGNYAESDVKEAARALTGRTVSRGQLRARDDLRDDGEKTILGVTANFDGDKLVDHLLRQPAAADHLARRLCDTFLGEGVADAPALSALAAQLRGDDLHIGRAVETILGSTLFFSEKNLHARVSDPVGFVIGAVRALEQFDPPPSTLLLAEWTGRLGQELFFPPNVGGWPGGRAWLTGRAIVARANFATALALGRLGSPSSPPDLLAIGPGRDRAHDPIAAIRSFGDLLAGRPLDEAASKAIWEAAADTGSEPERLNRAVALLLARPEAQLA